MHNQQEKKDIYRIDWIGQNGTEVYTKVLNDYNEAITFAKPLKDSIILRLTKQSDKAFQWQIVPTPNGSSLLKTVAMRRELDKKGKLINREGISSVGLRTTPEFQKSQKARMISMIVVPAVCGFTAFKYKELPIWLRGALVTVAVGTLYVNGRNFISNVKHNLKQGVKQK